VKQQIRGSAACALRSVLPIALVIGGCYQGVEGGRGNGDTDGTGGSVDGGVDPDGGSSDGGSVPGEENPTQPLHRLNRLEYDNTVRDLLGTDLRPAQTFGPDPEANGFDNMAEQLGISSVLLDGYQAAARDTIADGIDERPVYSVKHTREQLGIVGGYAIGELWALSGAPITVNVDVPQDGDAQIILTAGISVVGGAASPQVSLEVDGVVVSTFAVQGTGGIPVDHVHPMVLTTGPHAIRVIPTNFVNSPEINVSNNVFASSLTVRSVALTFGPGRSLVYVCDPTDPNLSPSLVQDCYETIIRNFAFRAWRRPLTADEDAGLVELFAEIKAGGEAEPNALRMVMRAVMMSPKFLFRSRTTGDDDGDGWLDPWVLASRLSYFLWSSMPDDRLFDMAKDGSLATDEGLSEAVAFMLADPKAQALLDGFAEQWLSTRHLPDGASMSIPGYDADLAAAMTEESKLFFGDFLTNDQPVSSIVQPEFAFLNDRLALHYGVAAPNSAQMVKVVAGEGSRRGLLTLGAWLTTHSDGEHSAPIRRGRWASDTLLCSPVPPPPAGVAIDPIELDGSTSVRDALEQHRSDPSCSSCHKLLDVLGIGFEEYDGLARLLTDPNIDNLGELPDGREFEGAAELASLYADSEVFVGCLTQKLFTYAVGRAPKDFDIPHLQSIARGATARGDDLPAVIDEIVHTPAFRSPAAIDGGE
jgi:hypothetical protein